MIATRQHPKNPTILRGKLEKRSLDFSLYLVLFFVESVNVFKGLMSCDLDSYIMFYSLLCFFSSSQLVFISIAYCRVEDHRLQELSIDLN